MIFPLNLPHAQRLEVPGPLRPDSDVLDRQNVDPARRESSAMAGSAALTDSLQFPPLSIWANWNN